MRKLQISVFVMLLGNLLFAQYDHLLPESEYPYWPEYEYLDTDGLHTIEAQPWIDMQHVIDGWDWSLPEYVEPSPRGLVGLQRNIGWDKTFDAMNLQFKSNGVGILWVKWRDIEKTQGNIDFGPVISRIEQANSIGLDVILRILCHSKSRDGDISKGEAPLWLEDLGAVLSEPTNHNHNFYPGHPVFHEHYLNLVNELAKTDIPQMVKAAYAGYASHAFGDEGIGPYGENNYQANDTVKHVQERLDAWENAFKGMEYKIFMGGPSNYGFEKGFGARRGFVEMYWYHIPDEIMGQQVDNDGYLYVDENAPLISNECFNGEVNEEYEKAWATPGREYRFGETTNSFPYRYFMSNLRVLQMRCTYVHTTGHLIPEMLPFIGQELGRTVEDTPDAWSFLVSTYLKSGFTRNWERWLYQRDAPGYETQVAMQMQQVRKMWMIENNKYSDYIARKGKKMGFNVDDRLFPGGAQKMAIKISFYDGVEGKLKLLFDTNDGIKADSVQTTGEDKMRTATFFVEAKMDNTSFEHDFDFVIESEEEVPVSMVRVIKTEQSYIDTDQSPYGGINRTIPGIIEGEHYDVGGEGLSYHDTDKKKGHTEFRADDLVDIVVKTGNDTVVGYTSEGEWLEYLVDVTPGRYDITLHYYCGETPGALKVSLHGEEIATIQGIVNGGWDTANTASVEELTIEGGENKILRLEFVNGAGFDLDAIEFTKLLVPAEGVLLSNCPENQLRLGDSLQLMAEVLPIDADDQTVIWSSSDPDVATVTNEGWVNTVSGGSATFTVASTDGNYTQTCMLKVFDSNAGQLPYHGNNSQLPGRIEAEEFDLGGEGIAYHDDEEKTGNGSFRPDENVDIRSTDDINLLTHTENDEWVEYTVDVEEGYYDIAIHYISNWPQDCELILSLDGTELARFSNLTQGPDWETLITETKEFVQVSGGEKKILRLTISETNANVQLDAIEFIKVEIVDVSAVSINSCPSAALEAGAEFELGHTVMPTDATFKGVSWSSSNEDVAVVDANGKVRTLAEGEVSIAVSTEDGDFSDQCQLTINRATVLVTSIAVHGCPLTALNVNDSHQLSASITPNDADDQGVSWSTSDEAVLTIDESGLIRTHAEGTATIRVKSNDGEYTDECQVMVQKPVVNVRAVAIINCPSDTLFVDSIYQFSFITEPLNATDKGVIWTSSNESLASVNADGLLTAIAPGEVIIQLTTNDGGFSDECLLVLDKKSTVRYFSDISDKICVYPNPASGALFIEFPQTTEEKRLTIYNLSGQQLLKKKVKGSKIIVDLSSLMAEDMVFVEITVGDRSEKQKILLQ